MPLGPSAAGIFSKRFARRLAIERHRCKARSLARGGSRPDHRSCTHKSRLLGNRWLMSASAPKAAAERTSVDVSNVPAAVIGQCVARRWPISPTCAATSRCRFRVSRPAAAIAMPVELTVILAQNAPTDDQSGNSRRIESATSHGPCSSRSRAHMRVFARKSAAVDPAATRGLRTRRDAALQPVCPGRSACQRLHVSLPSLP
jgi:hypothetical protein